jgi:hypothetical protein
MVEVPRATRDKRGIGHILARLWFCSHQWLFPETPGLDMALLIEDHPSNRLHNRFLPQSKISVSPRVDASGGAGGHVPL